MARLFSQQSFTTDAMLLGVTAISLLSSTYLWLQRSKELRDHQKVVTEWNQKRQEERTGRIRAEVKLREALAKVQRLASLNSNGNNSTNETDVSPDQIQPLRIIGTVISPYPKRMGTPRQGSLVPSSRGCIQFSSTLSPESVEGIQEYSHLWIIFQFHENTSLTTSKKTKIRPPRGGGIKVGQLSTRSPHRPNDIGLSLVTIDRWEPSTRRLYIRALDLVDGTPIYDIKPYVHWDIPMEVTYDVSELKLPKWVESKDDVLASVSFEADAEAALEQLVLHDKLCPQLYPKKDPTSLVAAKQTLTEILAQDPRSSHRGLTKNQRGTLSNAKTKKTNGDRSTGLEDEDVYRVMFGNATVEFVVEEIGAVVKNIFLRVILLFACDVLKKSGVSSCDPLRRKRKRRPATRMVTVNPSAFFLMFVLATSTSIAFSPQLNRGAWIDQSRLGLPTQLAMATSSKDLKQKGEKKPALSPGKPPDGEVATSKSSSKQDKASSQPRRPGTSNVVSRLARAAKEAHEARLRQLDGNDKEADHSALNEEKLKTQSKYPSRHRRKIKGQTAFDPIYHPMEEDRHGSRSSLDQDHLSTISTLNSVIDEELLHPPNGLKPLREVDSLRLLLEHNNLINEEGGSKQRKARPSAAHETAVVLARPLIDDQITVEFAARLVSLAKAIKFENYKPEWICFCPSLSGSIGTLKEADGSQGDRFLKFHNSVSDTAAGVVFFRHLCAANEISLDNIGICQVSDHSLPALSDTVEHASDVSESQRHLAAQSDPHCSWSPSFFHPVVESLVDEGYLDHWLEQSTDFESETDEYGMTREEPRKKIEIHWTLFSTDYELCNLNDIHVRSPRQSPMWHLVQDLENMIRNKRKFRRGILHTTWSFRYSVYPFVVYPNDTALSLSDSRTSVGVGSADSNLMAFLGKCYLMAQELVPLMVNLRGVAENSEFFQRDNYRRLVKTRRSLATLLEQMNEAYRHNREYKSETISIPPTLKSQLKQISPNTKSGRFQESLSKSEPNSSTEIQLESALLSLGRCCDLVRPAGTFSAQSVNRQEWRDALKHLYDFMHRIAVFCDPDEPLPAKLWGVQIVVNEPVLRTPSSMISHEDEQED